MLVPELRLIHPDAGRALLVGAFGFVADNGMLHLGSQALRVAQAAVPVSHGRIDHIALAVHDIDATLATITSAGVAVDTDITPDGVGEIAEFWDAGIRYVYLSGPEGSRIELCQRNVDPVASTGHDHIGIPCSDIAAMQGFFESHGARLLASVDLNRATGPVPVRFLGFEGGMVELYEPPYRARSAQGVWSRLIVSGLSAEISGPDGVTLAPF